jgi:hypothetical protein
MPEEANALAVQSAKKTSVGHRISSGTSGTSIRQRKNAPFCGGEWTRPESIKTRFINQHSDNFGTDTRNDINALQGRKVTQLMDLFTLCRASDMQVTSALPAPCDHSLS